MLTRANKLNITTICLLACLTAAPRAVAVQVVQTLAGSYSAVLPEDIEQSMWIFNRGFSGDGGSALEARLSSPTGVAFASKDRVLIADQGNKVVRVVNGSRQIFSITRPTDESFIPVEVAVTRDGEFLAVNRYNEVSKILLDDRISPLVSVTSENSSLGGISATDDGGLLITDSRHHQVLKMESDGTVAVVAGIGTPTANLSSSSHGDGGKAVLAHLNQPTDVSALPENAFIFADRLNNRIRMVDPHGNITTIAGSGPSGILGGDFSGDGGPATQARLNRPTSVAVLAETDKVTVFFSDTFNHRIRKFTIGGKIETIAGTGDQGFNGHTVPALSAKLSKPTSIDVDQDGRVVFADTENNLARLIEPLTDRIRPAVNQRSQMRRSMT